MSTATVTDGRREALEKRIMWNSGGTGWGICSVGNMLAAALGPQKVLPSSVAVSGPAEKYTDEELEKLVAFSEERTAYHRRICGEVLWGDNLTVIDKMPHGWLRKRLSWEYGPMFSDTLDEAMAFMRR